MNDEYLWQKTGEDPEIEKLEEKLAVFRFREMALNLPAVEQAVETGPFSRWRLSLSFAFAASLLAAVLVAVVFLRTSDRNDIETVFVTSPELEMPSSAPPPTTDQRRTAPASAISPPQLAQGKRAKAGRIIHVENRKPKAKDPAPSSIASLTNEEKYAYRQLMLALSISSSKLKIVQDTINGTENIERTPSTNQR